MSIESNKALVRRFIEEVQSRHRLEVAAEIMAPHMIDHFYEAQGLPQPENAVEAFKAFYSSMLTAFPDLHVTVQDLLAEGDKVVTYKTFHGTHQGAFRGIPPTGNKISVDVMDIFRIADGKLVEHWAIIDWLNMMQQLGAVSGPQGPPGNAKDV